MTPSVDDMASRLVEAFSDAVAAGRPNLPHTLDCLLFEHYAPHLDALLDERGEDAVMRVITDVRARFRELRSGRRGSDQIS